jgi:hypothetical protein
MSASLPVPPAAAGSLEMTEREWDKLVNLILDGLVVPVLGPELLILPENGEPTRLYDIWGSALAEQMQIARPEGARRWTIYDVANLLSQRKNAGDVAYDIDDVVHRRPWPVPDSLRNLARILDFSLYITTTVDHLMFQAMTEARPGIKVEHIAFTPKGKGKNDDVDLPNRFHNARIPGLYHLFGAASPTDGTFAKTEDDLIEWSWSLLDKGNCAPDSLYDYLQKKTVLLLGCSMPDWLGRFFIYAINGRRDKETINMYYVSQNCEPGLAEYLDRRLAKVVTSISPVEFAVQLCARWQERNNRSVSGPETAPAPAAPQFKSGAVFLSYFSEDRAKVRAIRDQLEAEDIDTWFDEQELPEDPGNRYAEKIGENIRDASFFVPIISREWERAGPKRFVRREWRIAEDAAKERSPEDHYLQPLIIDDTPNGAKFVDGVFQPVQWTRLREGRVPPAFIEKLSRGIRNFRRPR